MYHTTEQGRAEKAARMGRRHSRRAREIAVERTSYRQRPGIHVEHREFEPISKRAQPRGFFHKFRDRMARVFRRQ